MSEFDKEKEREKLREKYERDKQKREQAEKMSELLLKGATMTNAHCSECGDPVFRYDGQEFCATCERPIQRESPEDDETQDGDSSIEVTSPSDDTRVVFGGDDADATDEDADADTKATDAHTNSEAADTRADESAAEPDARAGESQPSQSDVPARSHADVPAEREADRPVKQDVEVPAATREDTHTQQTQQDDTLSRSDFDEDEGLAIAHSSLVNTLVRFSRKAEATEDPQRAREYLQTAREAAETLAALRS